MRELSKDGWSTETKDSRSIFFRNGPRKREVRSYEKGIINVSVNQYKSKVEVRFEDHHP